MFNQVQVDPIQALWQKLTFEAADIFDAHGVCATAANIIATSLATTTIVGIRDPQQLFYDVWVCHADGRTEQARWRNSRVVIASIAHQSTAVTIEKFGRSATELIDSELWQIPHQAILIIPLPFPAKSKSAEITPGGFLCLVDPSPTCALNAETIPPIAITVTTLLDRAFLRNYVDRQNVEFAVVSEISFALTSKLSLQNIFYQLQDPIRVTLNVESVSMGLIEPTTGDIQFVDILMGPRFKNFSVRLKKGQGIAGWVAENGQPLVINDVYTDQRFYRTIDHQSGFETHSMICIPLQVENRMIGVLQAINKQSGSFNDNDLRLLQALGGPLAAAIENARLHADVIAEKRRIETIFASMSEGLITVNAEGYITQVNDSLLLLVQKKSEEMIGQKVGRVLELKKGNFDEYLTQALHPEEEIMQFTADLRQVADEDVPVLISAAAIRNDTGQPDELIFVFSDLRQIREVERMRDDFFHGVVHELRTPLATILMYARLLREGKAQEKEKADRFLGVIERESDRLQKMVRQMLQLAKLEAREFQRSFEPVSLNAIFDDMLPPLADRATEKGLIFRQRVAANLPLVMGNPETYYLIFKNLVDNAIKFTLSGMVKVDVWVNEGLVQVEVKDEGIGIPPEAIPNLFRRFYRTQTAVERGIAGTGLGLYMVKESIENYNGSIGVTSILDKGTTFTVRLPAIEE